MGDDFGYDSKGLYTGKINIAGSNFGKGSENLRVEEIGQVGDNFGINSRSLTVGTIDTTGKSFGIKSNSLQVREMKEVADSQDFLDESKQAIIFQLKTFKRGEQVLPSSREMRFNRAKEVIIRDERGTIHSDLGTEALTRLKDIFGYHPYVDTLDLLQIKKIIFEVK